MIGEICDPVWREFRNEAGFSTTVWWEWITYSLCERLAAINGALERFTQGHIFGYFGFFSVLALEMVRFNLP